MAYILALTDQEGQSLVGIKQNIAMEYQGNILMRTSLRIYIKCEPKHRSLRPTKYSSR